jgi:acyl-coenzyme A thioesterase PaaI-like protein
VAHFAESPGQRLLVLWHRLSPLPGGHWLFSRLLGHKVPYTGSLRARIDTLMPGRARVLLRERRDLRNHLGSIHAIALANLCELASGLALLTALPEDVRGIVVRLEIDYLKKARGRLTAEGHANVPPVTSELELAVEATVRDAVGDLVAVGQVTWRLGRQTL